MRGLLSLFALLGFVRGRALPAKAAAAALGLNAGRPNLIFVMADDLGWGEVHAYPGGSANGRIATPHLDRFAREGMRFTNAYAGYTVCSPSRTAFYTGYHSGSFPKHRLCVSQQCEIGVGEEILLLPQMLKRGGYATAAFGKMAPLTAPGRQGFDYFVGQIDQAACHNMYPNLH